MPFKPPQRAGSPRLFKIAHPRIRCSAANPGSFQLHTSGGSRPTCGPGRKPPYRLWSCHKLSCSLYLGSEVGKKRSRMGAEPMEWATPSHEEIQLNCEVSSYANAEL